MAPETWSPASEKNATPDVVEISRLQIEAARNAQTIGKFSSEFKTAIQQALQSGDIHNEEIAQKRMDAVDTIARDQTDIALDTTEAGVLGYNRIGAGRSGMRISRQMLANIESSDDEQQIDQVIAHEGAHGKQAQLKGQLVLDGKVVDHELLYEGHAEIVGNEAVGMSMHEHREGQPEDVYKKGQDTLTEIVGSIGVTRSTIESVMTGSEELSVLQEKLDAKGRGRSQEETAAIAA